MGSPHMGKKACWHFFCFFEALFFDTWEKWGRHIWERRLVGIVFFHVFLSFLQAAEPSDAHLAATRDLVRAAIDRYPPPHPPHPTRYVRTLSLLSTLGSDSASASRARVAPNLTATPPTSSVAIHRLVGVLSKQTDALALQNDFTNRLSVSFDADRNGGILARARASERRARELEAAVGAREAAVVRLTSQLSRRNLELGTTPATAALL